MSDRTTTPQDAARFLDVLAWAARPHLLKADLGPWTFSPAALSWRCRHFRGACTVPEVRKAIVRAAEATLPGQHPRWEITPPTPGFSSYAFRLLPPPGELWPTVTAALQSTEIDRSMDPHVLAGARDWLKL